MIELIELSDSQFCRIAAINMAWLFRCTSSRFEEIGEWSPLITTRERKNMEQALHFVARPILLSVLIAAAYSAVAAERVDLERNRPQARMSLSSSKVSTNELLG